MAYFFLLAGVAFLVAFCIARDKRSSAAAIAVKTLTSLMFVATAVAALLFNTQREQAILPGLLMIGGLVCGLVGDVTLDFKIYLRGLPYERAEHDSDLMTYLGMAAFGVGHVLYIFSTLLRSSSSGLDMLWSLLVAIGLAGGIFALSLGVMKMRFGRFLVPSICYALLLCWFVVYSIWQLATMGVNTAGVLLLLGSILFIVSDLILSMTYFSKPEDYNRTGPLHPESKLMIVSNHVTYYAAQFLIALAILYI